MNSSLASHNLKVHRSHYNTGKSVAKLDHLLGYPPTIESCLKNVSDSYESGYLSYIKSIRLGIDTKSSFCIDAGKETLNLQSSTVKANPILVKQYKSSFEVRLRLSMYAKQNQRQPKWWI